MKKRMVIMVISVGIVFGGIIGFYFFKKAMMNRYFSQFVPPPAVVTTARVKATTWRRIFVTRWASPERLPGAMSE